MALTVNAKNAMLNALGALATHVSLLTALSDTAPTEVTGGTPAYARKPVTAWAAAASGSMAGPTVAFSFDVPAGTTVLGLGLHSALTAGTFYGWIGLQAGAIQGAGTVNTADVTANTITSIAHGLVANDYVLFSVDGGGALPAGLTAVSQVYRVIATGLTADQFSPSLTQGGAAVDITAAGELRYTKIIPEGPYGAQGLLNVAINALTLDLQIVPG
jgi:hypothetical protein